MAAEEALGRQFEHRVNQMPLHAKPAEKMTSEELTDHLWHRHYIAPQFQPDDALMEHTDEHHPEWRANTPHNPGPWKGWSHVHG